VKGRLGELDHSTFGIDLGPLGSVTFQRNADSADAPDAPDAAADTTDAPQ
jgi:hypothetical protein